MHTEYLVLVCALIIILIIIIVRYYEIKQNYKLKLLNYTSELENSENVLYQ